MARFTTLYSGSSGNSALVEENGRYLLVDMGKSCRMTQNALKGLGLPLADLGGILVTHEHSDHVSGLAIFLKYHPVPVYGSAATLDYLACRGLVPPGAELIDIDGRTEDVCGFAVHHHAFGPGGRRRNRPWLCERRGAGEPLAGGCGGAGSQL